MSVKFSLMHLKNPIKPGDPKKYYAKAQVREVIDLNRIVKEISYATSLTDGDVVGVLRALIYKTEEHLSDGDMVDLGDFGRFQYQLSSEGTATKSEFTFAQIKKVKLHFRPGRMWKPSMDRLQFEHVISVEERKEAKKKSKS